MSRADLIKIILLAVLVASAALAWWLLKTALFTNATSWSIWVLPIVFMAIAAMSLALLVALCGHGWHLWLAGGLFLLSYCVFFATHWYVWLMALLAGAFLIYKISASLNEAKEKLRLPLFNLVLWPIAGCLTALSLMSAYAWYVSPMAVKNAEQVIIPKPLFHVIYKPIETLLLKRLNNLSSGQGQIDLSNVQLPAGLKIPEGVKLPQTQEALSVAALSEDEVYQLTNAQFRDLLKTYKKYITVSLALALFGAIKTLSFPLGYILAFGSWGIIKLLIETGVVRIEKQMVEKEVLRIKN